MLSNPRSERVRAARRLAGRSARERAGAFLAEGPQAVREAVAASAVRELFLTTDAADRHRELVDAAVAQGVAVRWSTPEVLAGIAGTVTPQGLVAVCSNVDKALDDVLAGSPSLVAALSRVQDPGNAGTVLRAADAAGADAVVLTTGSVDVYNPKCVRSTAGSLFHLDVVVGAPLPALVERARAAGLGVLAADGAGPVDLDDLVDDAGHGRGPLTEPLMWVFGNEAQGLTADEAALADAVVRVPVHGRAESLNLATAATVCLYAAARARRRRGRGHEVLDQHEVDQGLHDRRD